MLGTRWGCDMLGLQPQPRYSPSSTCPTPTPNRADGEVKDFVKLHNSRAAIRGCGYAPDDEAELAAAAVAAAAAAEGCKGRGACAPLLRGASEAAPGSSSAADA